MYEIDSNVEFKDPKARKWVKGTITRIIVDVTGGDDTDYVISKPSGIEVTVHHSKVRPIKNGAGVKKAEAPATMKTDAESARLHNELQQAFDHFNKALFEDRLPKPFWVTIRRRNVLAHYGPKRWVKTGTPTNGNTPEVRDEININPDYIAIRGLEAFLSSIVHEMVHQWQEHQGNPPRTGYHNAEWGEKMETLGLIPSDTGQEGGKKTGQRMTHYIVDGPFRDACQELMGTGYSVSWAGAVYELHGAGTKYVPGTSTTEPVGDPPKPAKKKATRAKFTCPSCGVNAWAKPSANLMCGACQVAFVEAK